MIGNDIIDLKLAATQSNWQRVGWRDKVFTSTEKAIIDLAKDPFQMVWRLWSIKESAYKAYLRLGSRRFFDPKKLVCTIEDIRRGRVEVGGRSFETSSECSDECMHSVAIESGGMKVWSDIFSISPATDESKACHQKLLTYYAQVHSTPREELHIEKSTTGVPNLVLKSKSTSVPISISHHGRYGAFIIA